MYYLPAAVLAAIFGFGILPGAFGWLARILFAIFLALFCWSLAERHRQKKLRPLKGSFAQSFKATIEKDQGPGA